MHRASEWLPPGRQREERQADGPRRRTFAPEHALVAKQWSAQPEHEQHFFAVLDFADGQMVYQRVSPPGLRPLARVLTWLAPQLGLSNAPTFQLFKPTEGDRATNQIGAEVMDFSRSCAPPPAPHPGAPD
mgnify:CR=1 FL=1